MALGALFLGGCGDANTTRGIGGGGGTLCASSDGDVGDMLTCPESTEMIDFCIDSGSGNCYYVVGGDEVGCGNCFADADITQCALNAIERCNN